jgi:hypothetical protein
MADTWPVSGGSVGSRGSTETTSPRSGGDPRSGEEGLDAFGGEGATVIPGVGIDETPGANSATATGENQGAGTGSAAAGSTNAAAASAASTARDTVVRDISGNTIQITLDSFLQGLQGSLSTILQQGLSGLLANLPAGIQELLNSTGLAGALSGMVDQLSAGLSDALGQMAGALQGAAQQLASGLGEAISSIPGIGPVFDGFTQSLGALTENLQGAIGNLVPELQAGVNGLISNVGADLINNINIPGLPNINPQLATNALNTLSFANNPAIDLSNLSETARNLHEKVFSNTGATIFADIASKARRSSNEMTAVVQRDSQGGFGFVKSVEEAKSNVDQTYVVEDGAVVNTPKTFVDTLNSIQRQSFETYQRIAYNRIQDDRIPSLYLELITNNSPATPDTRDLYTNLSTSDREFVDNLVTRFNTFYASQRSGSSLTQDTTNRLG